MNGTATSAQWSFPGIAIPKIGDNEWELSGVELTITDENSNIKIYENYNEFNPYYGQIASDNTQFGIITIVHNDSEREELGDPAFYPGRFGYTSGTYTINVNTETMRVTLTKEE